MSYALLFIAWLVYYFSHSLLADPNVKDWMRKKLGLVYRFYRLAYNLLSTLFLFLLVGVKFWLPTELFLPEPLWMKIVGSTLSVFGSYVLIHSFFTVNLSEFLGFDQMKSGAERTSVKSKKLIRKGWYAWVRHPFYLGVLLILSGVVFLLPSWSVLMMYLATLVYLPFGVALEERKLITEFGEAYLKYRKEVKAILPYIF